MGTALTLSSKDNEILAIKVVNVTVFFLSRFYFTLSVFLTSSNQ